MNRYTLFAVLLSMFTAASARGEGSENVLDDKTLGRFYAAGFAIRISPEMLLGETPAGTPEMQVGASIGHPKFGLSLGVYGTVLNAGHASQGQSQSMLDPNSPAMLAQQAAARERLSSTGVGKDFRVGLMGRQGFNMKWKPDGSSEVRLEARHDHWLGNSIFLSYRYEGLLF